MKTDFTVGRPVAIRDGFTFRGYIAARECLHDELRFTYRPTTVTERRELINKMRDKGGKHPEKIEAAHMAGKLRSWNVADDSGDEVPIKAETILVLSPPVYDRLFAIVMGNDTSDVDPEWPDENASGEGDEKN